MKQLEAGFMINAIKVNDEDKYIITLGKYQACSIVFETEEEAEQWYYDNKVNWEMIACYIQAYIEVIEQVKKEKHENGTQITNSTDSNEPSDRNNQPNDNEKNL